MPGGRSASSRLPTAATLDQVPPNDMLITFGIAIIVVLLVLAAQFESFVSAPQSSSRPCRWGSACAIYAMALTGGSLQCLQPDRAWCCWWG